MLRITQLLDDDFRKHVGMYVGTREFSGFAFWISGFDCAYRREFPDEISELRGFKEWLLLRIGGDCCVGWKGIIREKYGDGIEATDRFFDLFDDFRRDVNSRGLSGLLKEHYDFEVASYGAPRISEYYSRGWDKLEAQQ